MCTQSDTANLSLSLLSCGLRLGLGASKGLRSPTATPRLCQAQSPSSLHFESLKL